MGETYDKINRAARRVGRKPDNWMAANMKWVNGYMVIDGGIPKHIESPPYLGKKYWGGVPLSRVVLTRQDLEAED